MKASLVYLSGPLPAEGADEDTAIMWRSLAAHWLEQHEVAAYNPLLALSGPTPRFGPLYKVNEAALAVADALLVNLADFSVPTPSVLDAIYSVLKWTHKLIVVVGARLAAQGPLQRCRYVDTLQEAVELLTAAA